MPGWVGVPDSLGLLPKADPEFEHTNLISCDQRGWKEKPGNTEAGEEGQQRLRRHTEARSASGVKLDLRRGFFYWQEGGSLTN